MNAPFPKRNPILIASPWALLRTRLKWDQFAALMQLLCTSPVKTGRCSLVWKAAAPPCGSTQDVSAARCTAGKLCTSQTHYASTTSPPSTASFFHHAFCCCYSKNITSLRQPCWFKPSVCSQSLIRLTISIMELLAFIRGLVRSQMGFLTLFGLILHAQIMTVNYSIQLTAFTKRLVILKADWWSPNMVPLLQPLVPDTARWICWHCAINQWILPTDKGVWQVHASTAATIFLN